jgi:hypothetical protein
MTQAIQHKRPDRFFVVLSGFFLQRLQRPRVLLLEAVVSQYVRPAVPPVFEPAVKPHASVYEIVTSRILAELESQAEYYSTLFHELTHSTGHAKRLAWEGLDTPQRFGSESYAREELPR